MREKLKETDQAHNLMSQKNKNWQPKKGSLHAKLDDKTFIAKPHSSNQSYTMSRQTGNIYKTEFSKFTSQDDYENFQTRPSRFEDSLNPKSKEKIYKNYSKVDNNDIKDPDSDDWNSPCKSNLISIPKSPAFDVYSNEQTQDFSSSYHQFPSNFPISKNSQSELTAFNPSKNCDFNSTRVHYDEQFEPIKLNSKLQNSPTRKTTSEWKPRDKVPTRTTSFNQQKSSTCRRSNFDPSEHDSSSSNKRIESINASNVLGPTISSKAHFEKNTIAKTQGVTQLDRDRQKNDTLNINKSHPSKNSQPEEPDQSYSSNTIQRSCWRTEKSILPTDRNECKNLQKPTVNRESINHHNYSRNTIAHPTHEKQTSWGTCSKPTYSTCLKSRKTHLNRDEIEKDLIHNNSTDSNVKNNTWNISKYSKVNQDPIEKINFQQLDKKSLSQHEQHFPSLKDDVFCSFDRHEKSKRSNTDYPTFEPSDSHRSKEKDNYNRSSRESQHRNDQFLSRSSTKQDAESPIVDKSSHLNYSNLNAKSFLSNRPIPLVKVDKSPNNQDPLSSSSKDFQPKDRCSHTYLDVNNDHIFNSRQAGSMSNTDIHSMDLNTSFKNIQIIKESYANKWSPAIPLESRSHPNFMLKKSKKSFEEMLNDMDTDSFHRMPKKVSPHKDDQTESNLRSHSKRSSTSHKQPSDVLGTSSHFPSKLKSSNRITDLRQLDPNEMFSYDKKSTRAVNRSDFIPRSVNMERSYVVDKKLDDLNKTFNTDYISSKLFRHIEPLKTKSKSLFEENSVEISPDQVKDVAGAGTNNKSHLSIHHRSEFTTISAHDVDKSTSYRENKSPESNSKYNQISQNDVFPNKLFYHPGEKISDNCTSSLAFHKTMSKHNLVLLDPPELSSAYSPKFCQMNLNDHLSYGFQLMSYKHPSNVLSYAWSSLQSSSCVVISQKNSGLTTACIASVLNKHLELLSKYHGLNPLLLFVTRSNTEAENAFSIFHTFLKSFPKTRLISLHGHLNAQRKTDLINGCHILVSTLPLLLQAYKKKYICLDSLQTIVLDDAADVMSNFQKKVDLLKKITNHIPCKILLSHCWSTDLPSLTGDISRLIITDPLEIASYSKTEFLVELCFQIDKNDSLKSFLSETHLKRIICVESALEANKLTQMLSAMQFNPIQLTEWMSPEDMGDIEKLWSRSDSILLVVSENVLDRLSIYDANLVINYDFPLSKNSFRRRVNLMVVSIISNKPSKCIMYINENSVKYVHALINFFHRMTGNFEFVENNILKQSLVLRDEKAKTQCLPYKLFGFCPNFYSCLSNHSLSLQISNLPSSGVMSLKVITVINATNMFCRVVSYEGNENYITNSNFAILSTDFQFAMLKYVERPSITQETIEKKMILAYKDEQSIFHRIYILDVERYNTKIPLPEILRVFCVDLGSETRVPYSSIFELPIEFKSIPPLVVELVVVGLKPKHKEFSWSVDSNKFVSDHVLDKLVQVNIVTVSGNTLFSDRLFITENLKNVANIITFDLKTSLMNGNFASENEHFMFMLLQAVPEFKLVFQKLEIGTSYDVCFGDIEENGTFYICTTKDISSIETELETLKSLERINLDDPFCIVESNEKLYRGKILSRDTQYFVHLVDYGRNINVAPEKLYKCPSALMSWSTQSVKCRLYGVEKNYKFSNEVVAEIQSILENSNLKAIPLDESYIDDELIYIVKLLKTDDLELDVCVSSILFLNLLIKPSPDLLTNLYPCFDSSGWNHFIIKYINGDLSAREELNKLFHAASSSEKVLYKSDLEFTDQYVAYFLKLTPPSPSDSSELDVSLPFTNSNDFSIPPLTKWSQSISKVILSISMESIEDVAIEIHDKWLKVSYKSSQIQFGFSETLMHDIVSQDSKYKSTKNKIAITLVKKVYDDWDQLFKGSPKYDWLTYDWDRNMSAEEENIWTRIVKPSEEKTNLIPLKQFIVEPKDAPASWTISDESQNSLPSESYSNCEDI